VICGVHPKLLDEQRSFRDRECSAPFSPVQGGSLEPPGFTNHSYRERRSARPISRIGGAVIDSNFSSRFRC